MLNSGNIVNGKNHTMSTNWQSCKLYCSKKFLKNYKIIKIATIAKIEIGKLQALNKFPKLLML